MSKTFGVEDFAKLAKVEVTSARVILRKAGIKKKGKNYEFKNKEEMQAILTKRDKKAAPAKKAPAKKKAAPKAE